MTVCVGHLRVCECFQLAIRLELLIGEVARQLKKMLLRDCENGMNVACIGSDGQDGQRSWSS